MPEKPLLPDEPPEPGNAGNVMVGKAGSVMIGRPGNAAVVVVAVVVVARLEDEELVFALEVITAGLLVLEVVDELEAGRVVVIKVVELDFCGAGTEDEEDLAGEDATVVEDATGLRLDDD